MRHLLAAILIAASAPALTACETINSPDRVAKNTVVEAAAGVVRSYARTWNDRDMTGFGALYAPDARYVNSTGTFLRGRSAIVATHRDTRKRYPESARMSTTLRGARAITNDAIVAVMGLTIRDDPKPEPVYATRLTLTLVKREGVWVIAQAQATGPS
jgi:uncharacterized protein (TIGR02246 family)